MLDTDALARPEHVLAHGPEAGGAPVPAAPPPAADDPGEAAPAAVGLARSLGLSITVADVLHRAGHADDEATRRFLEPRLAHLSVPDAMIDREPAAERIARAIQAGERIAIFGDYDCDGITSAAVMTSVVRALGGEAVPLLATRVEGSYGFSAPALARVQATGATLLVTCDCGSSDHERLRAAQAAGIDAVVIDHHLVPAEPLPAVAFLNPHRPECGFPYKGMASCGLALSLGAALRQRLGKELDLRPLLDLVAIGTVADVAPLDGDNRALVRAGLSVIAMARRPGLRALCDLARFDPSRGVSAEDIAFRIAPRLNAPGRLGHPDASLELLLCRDAAAAAAIAATVEDVTRERRAVQETMVAEAIAEIEGARYHEEPAILLAREGWHPGVVGIVAGRVASRYGKPTIIVGLEGARGRGSVRGPQGFHLYDALSASRAELAGFGGHQAAAGVEVRAERVGALRDLWSESCLGLGSSRGRSSTEIYADVRLDPRDAPAAVVRDLARLEPCGEKNRAPRILLRGAEVRGAREIKGHLKLDLAWGGRYFGAFGYELGALAPSLAANRVSVVGRLRQDTWNGGDAVEIRIERVGVDIP